LIDRHLAFGIGLRMIAGAAAIALAMVGLAPSAAAQSEQKRVAQAPAGPSRQPPPPEAVPGHAVLYEEDPSSPAGRASLGSAAWRVETGSGEAGRPSPLAVRADIEIPERQMRVTWTLRPDTEPNPLISHTVDILFRLPPDFPAGGIANVPGIWTKPDQSAQGTALYGQAVKVTDGYFLIGLSNVPSSRERNMRLLHEEAWFNIPIVYSNNMRAILAIEKGTSGEQAFVEAFAAWEGK
jgi:hypothetical protein